MLGGVDVTGLRRAGFGSPLLAGGVRDARLRTDVRMLQHQPKRDSRPDREERHSQGNVQPEPVHLAPPSAALYIQVSQRGSLVACRPLRASRLEEPPVVTGEALTTPASFGPGYCRVRGMPSRT